MNYAADATYKKFVNSSTGYASATDAYTFSNFYFKGKTISGECAAWNSFTSNQLLLPFTDLTFSQLTLEAAYYDFPSKTTASTTAVCAVKAQVSSIVSALQAKRAYSGSCNGVDWRVKQCSGKNIVCVACSDSCDDSAACSGKAFALNSCGSCTAHASAYAVLQAKYSQKILYPEFAQSITVTPAKNSVAVRVNVTTAGTVYCASLPTSPTISTVLSIKNAGSKVIASSKGVYTLTLSSLSPSTHYNVTCYTEDFASHVMPLATALANQVVTQTDCCKSVQFTTKYSQIVQYVSTSSRAEQSFVFTLDSKPSASTTMHFTYAEVSCSDGTVTTASSTALSTLPSQFTFTPDSASLSGTFRIRSSKTGCFTLALSAVGTDTYDSATAAFTVEAATAPPAVPVLSSVRMSDRGTSVYFTFDSATDRGATVLTAYASTFNCSLVFRFPGSNAATCKWLSTTRLDAILATSGATQTNIDDQATLRGSIIRAACVADTTCSAYTYVSETSQAILTPLSPLQPTVSLTSSAVISSCSDAVLDPTLSSGFGGRDWSGVLWSVTGTSSTQSLADISAYLNSECLDAFAKCTVPTALLTASVSGDELSYTFMLQLTNFLGQSSIASVAVSVDLLSTDILPSVTLSGTKDVFYRWKPLSVFASISWPTCAPNTTTTLPVTYSWKLYQGTTYSGILSTSLDQRFYKLSAYTVKASTTYVISVTASVTKGDKTLSASVSSTLVTGQSDVLAQISGASARTASTLTAVTLDASPSQDVDYPTKELQYAWSCAEYSPTFGAACSGFVASAAKVQTIAAQAVPANVYTITVTVSNSGGKSSTASVLLTLLETSIPTLAMSDAKTKYNPDDKVILSGTVTTVTSAAFAKWTSTSIASFDSSSAVLTPLSKTVPAKSSYQFQLSLAAGSLTAGLSYTFQLGAYYANNKANSAASSVTVVMNAPPSGGILTASPTTGVALTTQFTLTTSRWTDDAADLPLSYVISSYTLKATNLNTVKSSDGIPYVSARLGQGLSENNYAVYCVATASDIYLSSATATATVTVTPPESNAAVVDATNDALDSALSNGDPSAVQQAVSGALSSVNSVNCTVPTPCSTLHREACSETAKTCGPCLDGYVGVDGDSNKACKTKGRKSRRLQDEADADEVESKTCPSDCSGQGNCVFFDLYANEIPACNTTNPLCRARCVCSEGYYGKSCTLTQTEYAQLLSLREALCSSIYKTLALQDVTADVVGSRALSISNILLDINQISDAALSNCTAALVETVTEYPAYSCQGNSLSIVSKALSNVLERGNSISADLLNGVNSALVSLTAGCQESLGVGEAAVTLTTTNVNLLTAVTDKDSLNSTAITAPQSDYDAENGVVASTVAVNTTSLGDGASVGITIYQLTNNPTGAVTNSSQIAVQTTMYGDSTTAPGVTLVLVNNEPIDYSKNVEPSSTTVQCDRYESKEYDVTVDCGSGHEYTVLCPAYAKGTFNVTCPGYSRVPECRTFDGESFVVNPLCSVVAYDSYSTSCYCEAAATRRYLASGEEVATQYASSLGAIATHFGTTFTTAPSLSDVRKNWVILATLIGVLGTWALGVVVLMRWDKRDSEHFEEEEVKEGGKRKKKVRMVFHFFDSIFPDELRAGNWYTILLNQLRAEHFLVRVFSSAHKEKAMRTEHWCAAMGKIIAFLFMNSLVASTMYPDDGYCEAYLQKSACETAKTVGGLYDACVWKPENSSCEFQPPQVDFLNSIIITLVVTMLTVPLDKLIEANVQLWAQYFHYAELERKVGIQRTPPVLLRKFDEFSLSQTYRSTLLRAARLDKARRQMDFVGEAEEARLVAKFNEDEQAQAAATWDNRLVSVFDQMRFKQYRYSIDNMTPQAVMQRVKDVRTEAESIQQEMDAMDSVEEQEKYLMRQFIVHSFPLIQRGVVAKYFLRSYELKRTEYVKNMERASFVFLPILIAFLTYYVYVFNLSIGSRATNMWLAVTFIGLTQDIFLLAPTKVFINFIVINGNVAAEVRALCERMSRRSKLIMMRTNGMMRDAGSLIQHFNPACRVARMYPHLPIARLLLSLNDHDLPHRELPHVALVPWMYFSTGIVALVLLPDVLQETALDISSGAIGDFGLIFLYFLSRWSLGLMIALIVVVVLAVVGLTLYWNRRRVRELFAAEKDYQAPVKHNEKLLKAIEIPSEPSSPVKRAPGSGKNLEADFAEGAVVSDLFTLEEYNADDGETEQFGSVWGLTKNKTRSAASVYEMHLAPRSAHAYAVVDPALDKYASEDKLDALFVPAVRSFKPEVDLPSTRPDRFAVTNSNDDESFEAPLLPIAVKPVVGSVHAVASMSVLSEDADMQQTAQEALEHFDQARAHGGLIIESLSPGKGDAALLDGPRIGDIQVKPSSKVRLEPLERGSEDGSVSSSTSSSPSKRTRSRKDRPNNQTGASADNFGEDAV
jgi:hypothetical protein